MSYPIKIIPSELIDIQKISCCDFTSNVRKLQPVERSFDVKTIETLIFQTF